MPSEEYCGDICTETWGAIAGGTAAPVESPGSEIQATGASGCWVGSMLCIFQLELPSLDRPSGFAITRTGTQTDWGWTLFRFERTCLRRVVKQNGLPPLPNSEQQTFKNIGPLLSCGVAQDSAVLFQPCADGLKLCTVNSAVLMTFRRT